MIELKEVQKRLAEEIKFCKMSQRKIARLMGVSQQTVANYVNGQRLPSLDMFANMCKVLDLDAQYILFQE